METATSNVKTPKRSLRLTCPQCEGRELHYLEAADKLFCKRCEIVAWHLSEEDATRADQLDQVVITIGGPTSTKKRLIGCGFSPRRHEPIPASILGPPWWTLDRRTEGTHD